MRAVRIYLRERFPVGLTLLMAVSFACLSLGIFSVAGPLGARWWLELFLLTAFYEALLLRYRVIDEWKDFAHDSASYPQRPLQRGAISIRALWALGIVALLVELAAVVGLGGPRALALYLPVLALSALTAVEYFAKEWMAAHFTAAFVLHELIYIPLFAWVGIVLGAPFSYAFVCAVLGATLAFVSVEIVRKFEPRHGADGQAVADSYSVVWGRERARIGMTLCVLASGVVLGLASSLLPILVSTVAAGLMLIARRNDRALLLLAGIHLPVLALAVLL